MPVQAEPNYLGDWLKFEEDNNYSRDEVTVASGQNLATGTVVVSRLSWKWRERSTAKITERTREETTKALHR